MPTVSTLPVPPRRRCPHTDVTTHGAESVTVPGAVGGWAALAERYGRLGLDRCLSDAIDAAENGFAVTPLTAAAWARGAHVPEEYLPAPRVGEIVRLPDLAGTLRGIADERSQRVLRRRCCTVDRLRHMARRGGSGGP